MKTVVLALTLLGCCAWVAAQTGSGSSTGQTGSQTDQTGSQTGSQTDNGQMGSQNDQTATGTSSGMNGSQTIQGCLTNSGGNYMLTDASGMQYQLQGDTSKLDSYVNNEVQVKGMASSAAGSTSGAGASAGAGNNSGSTAGGTQGSGTATTAGSAQAFSVSKVKKLSSTCKTSK
ncbi:MAG TPA: hypothetical protein VGF06_00445 [Terriglobales bacterium]|jgi:hypothetical protein